LLLFPIVDAKPSSPSDRIIVAVKNQPKTVNSQSKTAMSQSKTVNSQSKTVNSQSKESKAADSHSKTANSRLMTDNSNSQTANTNSLSKRSNCNSETEYSYSKTASSHSKTECSNSRTVNSHSKMDYSNSKTANSQLKPVNRLLKTANSHSKPCVSSNATFKIEPHLNQSKTSRESPSRTFHHPKTPVIEPQVCCSLSKTSASEKTLFSESKTTSDETKASRDMLIKDITDLILNVEKSNQSLSVKDEDLSQKFRRCHYYGVVQLSVWEAGEGRIQSDGNLDFYRL